jgi:glutathione peroxidase
VKRLLGILLMMALANAGWGAETSLHGIRVKDIDGKERSLGEFKGKVLLVVNVASECGLTGQYAGLEELHKKYKDKGFAVLGFPCNDFGGQEPGTEKEIKQFCQSRYQVTFPMFAKIKVTGSDKHVLYDKLTGKASPFPGEVGWNFAKFLVGKDGKVLKRFEPDMEPEAEEINKEVAAALAAK